MQTNDKKDSFPRVTYNVVEGNALHVSFSGIWSFTQKNLPTAQNIVNIVVARRPYQVLIDTRQVENWDSCLPALILKLNKKFKKLNIDLDYQYLTPAIHGLLLLAKSSQEKIHAHSLVIPRNIFERTGDKVLQMISNTRKTYEFMGELTLSMGRLITGRARFLLVEFWMYIQEIGPDAALLILLISFIIGVILAFLAAVQLAQFDAAIYVANLVVIGMVRDIGPIMTAIIMAGRTGASFAASIGAMNVNEEVDALKTMGFPAIDFLVLPRMLAIVLMTPLLVIYSDFFGILGGVVVGTTMLDLSFHQYVNQTIQVLNMKDVLIGIIKTVIFAFCVGFTGCQEGINCHRSAQSVGKAATTAVVKAILYIVILDGIFALILHLFGL